jgi:hypothetical protein
MRSFFKVLLLTTWVISSQSYSESEFPVLTGPYLGQNPPSLTAEVFAPGIVSTEVFEAFGVFTPDMQEFYFVRGDKENKKHNLLVIRNIDNRWIKSVVGPRKGEPFITPDGKTMHLGRRYIERTSNGWSEVKNLGAPYQDMPIMRLTASSKGTYFFDKASRDGVIRYSKIVEGKRTEPEVLGPEINSGKLTAHPYIAPDESYLIWDSEKEGGYGESDLYISFREEDGSWGSAINFGSGVNSEVDDAFGNVTPDGKYLFFYRDVSPGNLDIYWVSAEIITQLKDIYFKK